MLLGLQHGDLAIEVDEDAPQSKLHRRRLEQLLFVGSVQLHVIGDVVGQSARLLHRPNEALDDLFRHAPVAPQLRGLLAHLAKQTLERRVIRVQRTLIFQRGDYGLEKAFGRFAVVQRRGPPIALQQQLQSAGETLDLRDPADDPHGVKHFRTRLVDVFPLRHREDALHLTFTLERLLDGAERLVTARDDRRRHAREDHRLP